MIADLLAEVFSIVYAPDPGDKDSIDLGNSFGGR